MYHVDNQKHPTTTTTFPCGTDIHAPISILISDPPEFRLNYQLRIIVHLDEEMRCFTVLIFSFQVEAAGFRPADFPEGFILLLANFLLYSPSSFVRQSPDQENHCAKQRLSVSRFGFKQYFFTFHNDNLLIQTFTEATELNRIILGPVYFSSE